MTPERRTRTRAFLFADLRGYSAFTERYGDEAAAELIGRYRRLVRERIAPFDGAEIRTEGDSVYVVFDSVSDAVNASLAIRDAAGETDDGRGSPIQVGIGVHAGESRDGEHGIVSSAVNLAARVCAAAPPGEVLVTETVRSLIRTVLPIEFRPVGRRRLKGIAEPIALHRVEVAGTRTASRRPTAAMAVAGVLVVAAVAAALALRSSLDATAGGLPSASATAAASSEPPDERAATDGLSRFNDPGEYPNVAEKALLERLLTGVAETCDRADPADRPLFHFGFDEAEEKFGAPVALNVRAGVSCLTQGTRVLYWQASGSGIGFATDQFFNVVQRLSLDSGDCSSESRVYGTWEAGAHSGQVLCYISVDGDAVIEWTFDEDNIFAVARRRDGTSSELYEWWRNTGRRLGR